MPSASTQDRRTTAAAFLTLFGMMTAHALLETARDALFLAKLPASHLPWAYLAIAGLAVLFARANHKSTESWPGRTLLSGTLLVAAAITAGMWFLGRSSSAAVLYGFYVWTGLVATILVVQFWLLLSDSFTVSQAKRVYALIGAGGLLGATAGSVLAGGLLQVIGANELILVAASVFAVSAIGPRLMASAQNEDAPLRRGPADDVAASGHLALLRHPYLRRVGLIVLLSTMTVTGVDFLFKSVVASEVSPDRLGSFFAQFYAGLNALALLVQLLFAGWLVRTVGVSRSLGVMPLLVAFATLGFVLAPGLVLVLILRGADGGLRHSVRRTSTELLYVPLPTEVRHRFKALIDSLGQRGGQALASLIILAAISLGAGFNEVAYGIGGLLVLWLITISGVRGHYLELFRNQLRGGTVDLNAELPELDLHQLELLMSALNSENNATVVGAMDVLEEHGKSNLIPALILYHPAPEVVLRALELFAAQRRTDFSPIALRLMEGDNNEIRAAAIRAKSAVDPEEERLRGFLTDDSARVRSTAHVALITNDLMHPDEIESSLRDIIDSGSVSARRALARAIHYQPDERLSWVLIELGRAPERIILTEVAEAISAQPHLKYLNGLLKMLAHRQVRPAARKAILAVGARALDFLDGALADDTLDPGIRRHIPRTISRFHSPKATRILVDHLARESDGMTRFKILRGLGRMVANNPRLPLDRKVLRSVARATLQRIITVMTWRVAVERECIANDARNTRGSELLISLFKEKQRNATERLFRLLDLLTPKEDFRLIYAGITGRDAKARSSGRELLEHLAEPELRDPVLVLIDEISDERKLPLLHGYHRPPKLAYAALMRQLLDDDSEAVRCIAAYHIGEIGLEELRLPLEAARPERASYLRDVVEHALHLLKSPRAKEAPHHAG